MVFTPQESYRDTPTVFKRKHNSIRYGNTGCTKRKTGIVENREGKKIIKSKQINNKND